MLDHEGSRDGSVAAAEGVVTGDMVAQVAYCPRRLHLMYAEGRWAGNEHTDEGTLVHRNADRKEDVLPNADDDAPRVLRSITLADEELGARAKLDLLEIDAGTGAAIPLEIKKAGLPPGRAPYPAERIQLGLQAMLLRVHGYRCDEGLLYYAGSRTRVRVAIDEGLVAEVLAAVAQVRSVLEQTNPPLPLVDSPKCIGCSLNGICLPDETNLIRSIRGPSPADPELEDESVTASTEVSDAEPLDGRPRVRRLLAPCDDALPLYVQEPGAQVGKRSETLVVTLRGETLAEVRLVDVSQLVLCGNVGITAPAVHLLCEAGVPIVHLSSGHWFYGVTRGHGLRNAFDRAAQFRRCDDERFRFRVARSIVLAKGRNQRTLLRRNGPSDAPVLVELRRAIASVPAEGTFAELLGAEGRIAALYFGAFSTLLRPQKVGAEGLTFDFRGRSRRPPMDPVNAMLSFVYALLTKEVTVAVLAAGLDPYWGVYHRPRHGRPSLALDLMEELRPALADSAVLTAINTGVVSSSSFVKGGSGCALTSWGRKALIRAYEARLDQSMTHPIFGYELSWRRAVHLQAQLLARVFRGELDNYPPLIIR